MSDLLFQLDLYFLRWFNVDWSSPALDQFWLSITQLHKAQWFQWAFAPMLLLWLLYIYKDEALKILLATALAVGLADSLCYRVVKAHVERPRPFQYQQLDWVRKVGEAHGSSFPSNHASNIFAAALVLSWYIPPLAYFFYIFAALVGISRIALGVHFPSDVLAGMMLGIFVGFLVRMFLLNSVSWFRLRKRVSTSNMISSPSRIRSRRL